MVAAKPDLERTTGRCIAMSRSGRYVVVAESSRSGSKFEIVDALGTAPRLLLRSEPPDDFAMVGQDVWSVAGDRLSIHAGDGELRAELELGEIGVTLFPSLRVDASSAVARSADGDRLVVFDDAASLTAIDGGYAGCELLVALHGKRILGVRDREFIIGLSSQPPKSRGGLPGLGAAIGAAEILNGKAVVIVSASESGHAIDVVRSTGSLVHHVELPRVSCYALAEGRGLAIAYTEDIADDDGDASDETESPRTRKPLIAIDLRYGRVVHTAAPPITPIALDIDSDARHIVMAGYHDGATRLSVYHVPFADVFLKTGPKFVQPGHDAETDARQDETPAKTTASQSAKSTTTRRTDPASQPVDALIDPEAVAPQAEVAEAIEVVEIPRSPLRALRDDPPALAVSAPPGINPYDSPRSHLSDLLDLVVARTARAIANAWDSGELSQPLADGLPFEKEVRALIGHRAGEAPQLLAESRSAMERIQESVEARTRATLAAGIELPIHEVARQFKLSSLATEILQVVAAPSLRREAARLFGILSNDTARPVCDRALVEAILGATPSLRHAVSSELASEAPLLLNGLVRATQTGTSERLFSGLAVDSVLLRRLTDSLGNKSGNKSGNESAGDGPGAVSAVLWAERSIDELVVPDTIKRDLIVSLLEPTDTPARIVVRGRPGFGRTSLLAAIASRVDMPLVVIDTERLAADASFPNRLRAELQRAVLRGGLPCVSGLESRPRGELDQTEHVREVFRTFPGPIGFRTSVDFHPPLDPGFGSYTLPTLLESQRHEVWERALKRRGLGASSIARLAARFLVGPGTIESIVATVATRCGELTATQRGDLGEELDLGARQHLEARLGDVASRVERLARWEQVALPDEMIDSIREFIGRVVHRRTVYEQWGFAEKMATSRGLTALFYGQPGTGKTMVAGLIARELGLDLYRVDLANVTSKWIGETEKNLGKVFDAAEDGQAVILFDEADSLFAKRTEVKSSVDRYANLEVNYLLQRFDSFEGVAILTTNMEGSIDSAFKRRLSLRLEFPFPDEDIRIRLWAAHIPSQAPTRGDFDFVSLAQKFPMSGGYIRNSTLRAAFLAAQEGELLSQEHLERAILLEYRELGKLTPGGRMA